jgi:hypothetical protein
MSVRHTSIFAILAALAAAAAITVSGCGKSPAAADSVVTITQTTSTTTTTVIPDVTASGIAVSPQGTGLAAATLMTFSLQSPPSGGVPPYTITWEFGDGSAPAAGPTGNHKYLDPGDFTATATIRDSGDKSATLSARVKVGNASGDWGIEFSRDVVENLKMDILQNGESVTASINNGPGTSGAGSGTGGVANPRELSLSISFPDALPSPYVATFVGTLDASLQTWTGTATGFPGCPCDFEATR